MKMTESFEQMVQRIATEEEMYLEWPEEVVQMFAARIRDEIMKAQKPVAVTLGEPISDPCEDEQYWLDSIHSRIPIPEGTLLYLHPKGE
jgi:hypothetical protein